MRLSRRNARRYRRRVAQRGFRISLEGVPGAGLPRGLTGDGHDAVTFTGCVLSDPPPPEHPDHFWLSTATGRRRLADPGARPVIESLVGLHDPDVLADRLTGQLAEGESGAEVVDGLLATGWLVRLPGTLAPTSFAGVFGGFTLTRGPSQTARPDPASSDILMRSRRSRVPVTVPGWVFSHMVGPTIRPDLVETVAWKITDPQTVVERIDALVAVLPALLGDGIASLTPAVTSQAARMVDERSFGADVLPFGPSSVEEAKAMLRWFTARS